MQEEWEVIEDFYGYSVSSLGNVMNDRTGRLLRLNRNQRGFTTVGLVRDRIFFTRSVAQLVAKAFVKRPRYPNFDCVIHLDFDRDNNAAENLRWRTRWFAIEYYQQPEHPHYGPKATHHMQIADVDSGEVFDNSWDIVTRFGVLHKSVILSMANNERIYPTGQIFRRI